MATFSGGKALLRTDRIFVRTQTEYGRYQVNDGAVLYTLAANETAILRPIYIACAAGSGDQLNHTHVAAYFNEDYINDTNNNTVPTRQRRTFDLGIDVNGATGSINYINTADAPIEKIVPANSNLRIWTNYSGTVPSDEFFVFIAEIDVYSINNVIGNP